MDNKSKCALNSIFVIKCFTIYCSPSEQYILEAQSSEWQDWLYEQPANYGQAGKIAIPASGTSNFKSGKLSRLDDERILMQGGEGSGSSQPRVTPTPLDK